MSALVSAFCLSPDKNGKGVGVLSMIGPNPPMITCVGVDEGILDNKITWDHETNKGGKVEGIVNLWGCWGGANWLFGEFEICRGLQGFVIFLSARGRGEGSIYVWKYFFSSFFFPFHSKH